MVAVIVLFINYSHNFFAIAKISLSQSENFTHLSVATHAIAVVIFGDYG